MDYQKQIDELNAQLDSAESFMEKLEIKDKILEIKQKAGLISSLPCTAHDCESCSA